MAYNSRNSIFGVPLRKRFIKPDKNNPEAEFLKPCQQFSNLNMKSENINLDFENIVKAKNH
jgi:hypothetical protein